MAEVDQTFIVEMLQAIRADLRELKEDVHHIKVRQTVLEGHLTNLMASVQLVNERVDSLAADMRIVKRRLELADTH